MTVDTCSHSNPLLDKYMEGCGMCCPLCGKVHIILLVGKKWRVPYKIRFVFNYRIFAIKKNQCALVASLRLPVNIGFGAPTRKK